MSPLAVELPMDTTTTRKALCLMLVAFIILSSFHISEAWEGKGEGIINVKAHEFLESGLNAIYTLEKGVLDGANIVDDQTGGVAIAGLKMAIGLIPVPSTRLSVKIAGELIKPTVSELIEHVTEQYIDVDTLYSLYSNGYFSSTMQALRDEIVNLDNKFHEYSDIFPADSEFVKDIQYYWDYIKWVGKAYPNQLESLVEAHEARERDQFVADLLLLGGGIALVAVTGGTGLPVLIYSAFKGGYDLFKGINDIREEADLYNCLRNMSFTQSIDAIYFANQIVEGIRFISDKLRANDFSFPEITITPLLNGWASVINEHDKPIKVKVQHTVTLHVPLPKDHIPAIPEVLETRTYGNTYELTLQANEEKIFSKPLPPDRIKQWIDKVCDKKYKIEEVVTIRVFYGEQQTGPIALKDLLLNYDYLVVEQNSETYNDYGTMQGTTAALINVKMEEQKISTSTVTKVRDIDIETEAEQNKVTIKLSSVKQDGRTIAVNVDRDILPVREERDVLVLYDGKEIMLASNYTDVLNPNDEDVPEYFVIMLSHRIRVLVSIPSFSSHMITITKRKPQLTLLEIINHVLYSIPLIGTAVRFLDNIVPGYGSLLFASIIIAVVFLAIFMIKKRQAKNKK